MLASPVTLALALAVATSPAMGAYVGFNYGSTFTNGAIKAQADFEAEFKAAQALVTAPQTFSSARLYTMVQGGTANSVISAIPAAIATKTSLLLGIWASAGDANFANEIAALKSAIATYGADVGSSLDIAGISVGSEDLYRISPTGIENGENPGAQPDTLVNYIGQVKAAIAGTPFSAIPVGHVDTWTAWVNASNSAVAAASDFVGFDAYPYFEDTVPNSISDGRSLFNSALDQTKAAVGGKPVWITETGWPVSGPTRNQAVPSPENAKQYWDEVGCPLFGVTNTWWFTFQDAAPDTPSPSFGLISSTLGSNPLYDLSCNATPSSSSTGTSATPVTSVVTTVTTVPDVSGNDTTSTNLTTQTMTSHVASPSQPSSSSGTGSNGTFTSSVAAPTTTVVTTNNGAVHFVSVATVFAALLASLLVL